LRSAAAWLHLVPGYEEETSPQRTPVAHELVL